MAVVELPYSKPFAARFLLVSSLLLRYFFQRSRKPKDIMLLALVEVYSKVQCDERDAVLFCDQCKDFFCQGCFAIA